MFRRFSEKGGSLTELKEGTGIFNVFLALWIYDDASFVPASNLAGRASMSTASQTRTTFPLEKIQAQLEKESVDGWLFYFFKNNDPIALAALKLTETHMFSRRWYYFVPQKGEPVKLVHKIESGALDSLPGRKVEYVGWQEMENKLGEILSNAKTVAMQYSPRNAVPYVSRVDAGTIELICGLGKTVVTSANLVQTFEATWTKEQLDSHIFATEKLREIVLAAFGQVKKELSAGSKLTEYDIQKFILDRFAENKLYTYSPPIVAVNENSGNPHYQPTEEVHKPINEGDFLLIDLWAKQENVHRSVYGDITWTGFVGAEIPKKYVEIFEIVKDARNAGLNYVKESVQAGKTIYGWQVDEVTRTYIKDKGYGNYFVHRTGHSIGEEVHGNGANIDNLETRDERALLPCTGFSIEPGIYLAEFGVRSEIDVYIGEEKNVIVAGSPIQEELIAIMK